MVHVHNAHHFSARPAVGLFAAADPSRLPDPPILVNGVHDHVGTAVHPEVLDDFAWHLVLYVSACTQRALPSRRPSVVEHLGIDLRRFGPGPDLHPALSGLERPVISTRRGCCDGRESRRTGSRLSSPSAAPSAGAPS